MSDRAALAAESPRPFFPPRLSRRCEFQLPWRPLDELSFATCVGVGFFQLERYERIAGEPQRHRRYLLADTQVASPDIDRQRPARGLRAICDCIRRGSPRH